MGSIQGIIYHNNGYSRPCYVRGVKWKDIYVKSWFSSEPFTSIVKLGDENDALMRIKTYILPHFICMWVVEIKFPSEILRMM